MTWFWLFLFIVVVLFGFVAFRGAPYVPSRKLYIRQALNELYAIGKDDVLVDIGSGDGIVLREAAKLGARAVGYEINPILVLISKLLSRNCKQVQIRLADYWLSHVPDDTTVVYVFSVTRDSKKITKWMQKEANWLDRSLHLVNFGSKLTGQKSIKNIGAYNLYVFHPLQPEKAQV